MPAPASHIVGSPSGDRERRQGRGRLSSIDLLPEEAEEDVIWALEQLRERKLPQVVILVHFNDRLVAKGIEPVSKSAFSRFAVRKAVQFRELDEVRRITGELVRELGTDSPDDVTVAVAEMIKLAAFKLLERGGALEPKDVMELSRALASAVNAQKGSAEYRQKLEREAQAKVAKALDRAEDMAREGGLSADRIAQLRREFLGVKQ